MTLPLPRLPGRVGATTGRMVDSRGVGASGVDILDIYDLGGGGTPPSPSQGLHAPGYP